MALGARVAVLYFNIIPDSRMKMIFILIIAMMDISVHLHSVGNSFHTPASVNTMLIFFFFTLLGFSGLAVLNSNNCERGFFPVRCPPLLDVVNF